MPGLFDRIKDTTTFTGLLSVGTSFVVDNNPSPIYQSFRSRYSINNANIPVVIASQSSSNWMVCWCTYTATDTLRVDEIIFTSNTVTPDAAIIFSGTSDVFVTASSRAVAGLREANTFTANNYFSSGNVGIGTVSPTSRLHLVGSTINNSDFRVGSFNLQNYALNNTFLADNAYYDGTNMVRRETGGSAMVYLQSGEVSFRSSISDTAGTTVPITATLKSHADGRFAVGPSITGGPGVYTGASLFVSAAGNVGIGTISPSSSLHAVSATNFQPQIIADHVAGAGTGAAYFVLDRARGTPSARAAVVSGDTLGTLMARGHDGSAQQNSAWLSFEVDGTVSAGNVPGGVSVYVTPQGGSARLSTHFDASANVGIGTLTPSSKLSVEESGVRLDISPFGGATGYVGTQSNHPLGIITNNTEAIRVTTSGNVGIGLTSLAPNTALHIRRDTEPTNETRAIVQAVDQRIVLGARWVSGVEQYAYIASTSDSGAGTDFRIRTGSTDRFSVRASDGYVGIGTTNPLKKLDISGGGLAFTEAGGAARGIHWGDTTNIYPVLISGNATSGAGTLIFSTNTFGNAGVERMRIDSSGNVGIGTSNPLRSLEVNNVMRFTSASADLNDGVVGTAPFAAGLNIVGINTDGGGRKVSYWGGLQQQSGDVPNYLQSPTSVGGTASSALYDSKLAVINGNLALTSTTNKLYLYYNSASNHAHISTDVGGQVTISNGTGGVTEKVRIDTSGNVGIGTSPGTRLDVAGGSIRIGNNHGMTFRNVAGTGVANFTLQSDDNFVVYNAASTPIMSFTQAAASYAAYGANLTNRMLIDSANNVTSWVVNNAERMRIDPAGRVAINKTNPDYNLDVTGTVRATSGDGAFVALFPGNAYSVLHAGASPTTSGYLASYSPSTRIGFSGWWNGTAYHGAWTDGAVPIVFGTSGATRLTITADGNTSFAQSLQFNGVASIYNVGTDPYINVRVLQNLTTDTNVQDGMFINYNSTGNSTTNAVRFYTPGTNERMRIRGDGGVAIGTAGGDYGRDWRLVVRHDTAGLNAQIGIINGSTSANSSARFVHITGTGNSFTEHVLIEAAGPANFFSTDHGSAVTYQRWTFNGTERLRLKSNGNLVHINDAGPDDTESLGFRGAPVKQISASYTLVLQDAGRTIYKTVSTAITVTVPNTSSVNFPIGTCIIFDNPVYLNSITVQGASGVTIYRGGGTVGTGSRNVPSGGSAMIRHFSTNNWVYTGAGA